MRIRNFTTVIILFISHWSFAVCGQDMDAELTKMSESLATQIKDHGSKKITVLDFTDLDGAATELGKYLAEQMTVNFVMKKREFSVLDRANLKRILAEHKLTASGLINPENAKKLGMFAGVDGMVFGKAIPIGTNLSVTVQLISTETAEVWGGGKARFPQDESVRQLLLKTNATQAGGAAAIENKGQIASAQKRRLVKRENICSRSGARRCTSEPLLVE